MSAERFSQLCNAFCAAAGMPCPDLTPDRNGVAAFHATLRGYTATIVHAPRASDDDAFLLFDMGALPAHAGQDVCRTLMQTNFMMFGKSSPVLGLGRDDRLVLHMVLPLDKVQGPALHDYLLGLADWAEQWHASVSQGGNDPAPPQPWQDRAWVGQFA